jgi:hypothetical protein
MSRFPHDICPPFSPHALGNLYHIPTLNGDVGVEFARQFALAFGVRHHDAGDGGAVASSHAAIRPDFIAKQAGFVVAELGQRQTGLMALFMMVFGVM